MQFFHKKAITNIFFLTGTTQQQHTSHDAISPPINRFYVRAFLWACYVSAITPLYAL